MLYADEKAEPGTANGPRAVLKLIDLPLRGLREDANVGPYVGRGRTWSTVTPVVLPGYDDNRAAKALGLLRKSFVQAGVSEEAVAGAEIRFRGVGYRPGQDLARDYEAPNASSGPKYHVWVRFPVAVTGPLAVGKLRYRGLGLFALVEDVDQAENEELAGGREGNEPPVRGSE